MTSRLRFVGEPTDLARVGEFIAGAFDSLDVTRWLVPDPIDGRRILAAQFAVLAREHGGHIDVALGAGGEWTGIGVWGDRTGDAPGAPPDYDERLAAIAGARLPALQQLDAAFQEHHPDQTHLHLMFLAVAPHHQGAGIGTRLLKCGIGRAGRTGVAVYLEASSPRARDLYLRHEFTPQAPIRLPVGPELYPMFWTARWPPPPHVRG